MNHFTLRYLLVSSLVLFFGEANVTLSAASEDTASIIALVQQLGDDNFAQREQAEMKLKRIGIAAFVELRKALKHSDLEIVFRAERILNSIQQTSRHQETHSQDQDFLPVVNLFDDESELAQKTYYITILFSQYARSGHLGTRQFLFRLVRFESEQSIRAEAAKCLMASLPAIASKRTQWLRQMSTVFANQEDDDVAHLLATYANLWLEIDERRDEAEKQAMETAKNAGKYVEYPVPISVTPELKEKVRRLAEKITEFQKSPSYSLHYPGNRHDQLLFYHLAEMQTLVGLKEESERTLQAAQTIRAGKVTSENPFRVDDPKTNPSFDEHLVVAQQISDDGHYRWGTNLCESFLEECEVSTQVNALLFLGESYTLLGEADQSVSKWEQFIQVVQSKRYTDEWGDKRVRVNLGTARHACLLAQKAVENKDWKKAKELVDIALKNYPDEIDAIILRYKICKQGGDLTDGNYRNRMAQIIDNAMNHTVNPIDNLFVVDVEIISTMATMSNQVAWLLANTTGMEDEDDNQLALQLIQNALKVNPDSIHYLDTLAHVHAAGKRYDKAVEAQEQAVKRAPELKLLRDILDQFRREQQTAAQP